MAEFYNYVKRDYTDAPDWASVTKEISDELTEISKARVEKRAEIEKSTQETVNALNQQEMGANQTLNQMVLDGSREATSYLLAQNKLLKQNKIKPEQYMTAKQAQLDDWNTLSGSVKTWQQDYSEYTTRMEEDKSAGMEQSMAEWNESFGNVSNKSIVVNPTNGRLYVTTKNEDGSISKDPKDMVTVNALNNRMKDRIDKYDINGAVQKQVSQLGQILKVVNKDGIMTADDVRGNPRFEEAKPKIIKSLLGTDRNITSILSDAVGGYSFTQDPNMKGKTDENGNELILLKADANGLYQPDFSGKVGEAQLEVARDYVDEQFEMQIGRKETPTPTKTSSSGRTKTQGETIASAKFELAHQIASGNQDDIDRIVGDEDAGILGIELNDGVWTIAFDDVLKKKATFPSTGNTVNDALKIYQYTAGKGESAASADVARKAWGKQGGGSPEGWSADLTIDDVKFSEIKDAEGGSAYEKLSGILNKNNMVLADVISDINNAVEGFQLPGGIKNDMNVSVKNNKIVISSSLLDAEITTDLDGAPQALKTALDKITKKAVAKYNQGGSGGVDAFGNPL
jgi:hypothetical protein